MEGILEDMPTFSPRPLSDHGFPDFQANNYSNQDFSFLYKSDNLHKLPEETRLPPQSMDGLPSNAMQTEDTPYSAAATSLTQMAFSQFSAANSPQANYSHASSAANSRPGSIYGSLDPLAAVSQSFSMPSLTQAHFGQAPYNPSNVTSPTYEQLLHSVGSHAESGSFRTDNSSQWGEMDQLFTPLMSPAMTPLSVFSTSTGMHSTFKPVHNNYPGHQESFSPLTSPAIRPQDQNSEQAAMSNAALLSLAEQANLLGLSNPTSHIASQPQPDQLQSAIAYIQGQQQVLRAMGLGHLLNNNALLPNVASQLQTDPQAATLALQQQMQMFAAASQGTPSSSSSSGEPLPPQASTSRETSKGRGASRTATKTRPSPIIKPLGRTTNRDRILPPSNAASTSRRPLSSAPSSAFTSPMLNPVGFAAPNSTIASASVLDESPSPVDLELSQPIQHNQIFPTSAAYADQMLSFTASPNHQQFAPVTPASIMNLPSNVGQMQGLSPVINPQDVAGTSQLPPVQSATITQKRTTLRKSAGGARSETIAKAAKAKGKVTIAKDVIDNEDITPQAKKSSHKQAEQRRRDSLKLCFEELRHILPFIPPEEDEESPRRPGEGNVGGQRSGIVDPSNPNKGVSKVALLRKSNEYITKLHDRIDRRDEVIELLKGKLSSMGVVLQAEESEGYNLENIDEIEAGCWPYPNDLELDAQELGEAETPVDKRKGRPSRTRRDEDLYVE